MCLNVLSTFLPFSTHRPIPTDRLKCTATALAGTITLSGFKVQHFAERLGWVSQLAEEVGIACAPPCKRLGPPCGSTLQSTSKLYCVEWNSVSHWAGAYSRGAWERLVSYQLWAPQDRVSWLLSPQAKSFLAGGKE